MTAVSESLSKAINMDPKNEDAILERATCYFEIGDYEKSIKDFLDSGIKINKIDPC